MTKYINIKKVISGAILALFGMTLVTPLVVANAGNLKSNPMGMNFWGMEQDVMDNTICYRKDTTSNVHLYVSDIDYPVYAWVIGALEEQSDVFSNCSGGHDYYITNIGFTSMENTVRQWNYTHAGIQMMTAVDEQASCYGSFVTDTY